MPNIRVTCPACRSELEIDSAHEGQEIECGGCLKVFVAKVGAPDDAGRDRPARGSRRRDDDRPRRRRRDDYDDDDYEPRHANPGPGAVSVFSLVLGILSLSAFPATCCGCCSVLTWPITIPLALSAVITGAFGLNDPKGKPMAIAGLVLGCVALGFILIQLVVGFGPLMVPPPAAR